MQVIKQNIQRPTLFREFLDKLITYSNEFIGYINTSKCNFVTSDITTSISLFNNIKNNIKTKYIQIKTILIGMFQKIKLNQKDKQ